MEEKKKKKDLKILIESQLIGTFQEKTSRNKKCFNLKQQITSIITPHIE